MELNAIVQELMERAPSVEVGISINKNCELVYQLSGFYKSGSVDLIERDGRLMAYSRYDQEDRIDSLFCLVALNSQWLASSCEKTWGQPSPEWADLLVEYGFLQKEIVPAQTVYKRT